MNEKRYYISNSSVILNDRIWVIGGWNEEDEDRLYSFCEKLSNSNIKFAMSNVFNNKNIENTKLINWVKNNNFNVYTFDKFTYMACGKGNSNAQEVLITNY